MESVTFQSAGTACSAYLGVPGGEPPAAGWPAVVLGHGFGVRKESLRIEAEHLSVAGLLTLAIDYRTFGESAGEPRGALIPLNEVEDLRNAISFLETRTDVDPARIGLWGASFGGGVVIYTAAVDRRVRAVVAVAPVVNGRNWLHALWGGPRFEELLDHVLQNRRTRYRTGQDARIPTQGTELPAALPADARTGTWNERALREFGRPLLEGTAEITLESVERVIEFAPDAYIHLIAPRALCIITPGRWDVFHPYDQIREAFARAGEPKRLLPLPCEQMDVYLPPFQQIALDHAAGWFREHLGA